MIVGQQNSHEPGITSQGPVTRPDIRRSGRVLFLVTLFVSGGLFAWIVLYAKDRMPFGSYPIAFVLIPVLVGAAIFFVVLELLLRLCGIQVWAGTNAVGVQGVPPNGGPAGPPGDGVDSAGPPSAG